ncbi:MAG: hypothetical protein HQQ73_09070 [Desulfobulbaceae bacterium]|nr:hypothetical protein [Desulfobulbaceae bacterium]
MPSKHIIDLDQVEHYLLSVQRNFEAINEALDMHREPMRDEILNNMLAGYEYVNYLLKKDVKLLRPEGLHHFLELNNIVLCGSDVKKRKDFKEHIVSNTDRFYEQSEFSIRHLRSWAEKHRKDTPWKKAAGAYILQVSWPQLFHEGNHRTGALMMSTILVQHNCPPFVLSVDNAKAYFNPSSLAKSTNKNEMLGKFYKLPKIKKNFAKFLEKQAIPSYLRRR